jgi:hypothetical protein
MRRVNFLGSRELSPGCFQVAVVECDFTFLKVSECGGKTKLLILQPVFVLDGSESRAFLYSFMAVS